MLRLKLIPDEKRVPVSVYHHTCRYIYDVIPRLGEKCDRSNWFHLLLPRCTASKATVTEDSWHLISPALICVFNNTFILIHDDVIIWKHFPRYWPFVRGIHRSTVNSPHKGQWRGGLMFSLTCVWINGWVNNREAGDLRRYHVHCDVVVMKNGGYIFNFQQFKTFINISAFQN